MILFLTNADTEILALRVVAENLPDGFPGLRAANPAHLGAAPSLEGVSVVLVRLLGGRQSWEGPFEALRRDCLRQDIPLLAFGGESETDAELTAASTVPNGTITQVFAYLVQGGVANLEQLLRFVADTVLIGGFGFEAPVEVPAIGVFEEPGASPLDPRRPTVAIVFYRAHVLAGNTRFITDLCEGIRRYGANAPAIYTYSLREGGEQPTSILDLLAGMRVDAVVSTVLAGGSIDEEAESWDAGVLSRLDVPIIQAICSTGSQGHWDSSSAGLSPVDVAMAMAIPEFDGRIISVPFSFKETVDDGDVLGAPVTAYRTRRDRVDRVAELAVRQARLRHTAAADKRIAIVLSAYPTKRSRLGNAVGLDTPESVIGLLVALRDAGYRVDRIPEDGDELMAELADTLTYDVDVLSSEQSERAVGRWSGSDYAEWFATRPRSLRNSMEEAWGPAPGSIYLADGALVFAGMDLGGVLVTIQPPRGFGDSPVAVYHSPDLPPTHHYLAFYRWLADGWRADAVVHAGKHGTLEWLPGKGVGLSSGCGPDAALGSLPLVYPFVVNDPGEGAQAKRRGHAVIVDHLVPPLTRADVYDDLAVLEALLDTHARVAYLDPAKLPEVRRQVWDLLVEAEIHRDLGLAAGTDAPAPDFDDPAFDELLLQVDGYLCELKDAQIRGGLHVLGRPPEGGAEVDMVLAITRLPQTRTASLRATVAARLGIDLASGRRGDVDRVEQICRALVETAQAGGWRVEGVLDAVLGEETGAVRSSGDDGAVRSSGDDGAVRSSGDDGAVRSSGDDGAVRSSGDDIGDVLDWVCSRLVPALRATTGEIDAVLGALDGRFIPPGPSGAPSRGMAHVLPTGRNFFSVDPKAIPSALAWQVGQALADRLLERHLAEEGRYPTSVGLVVWGTSAMRTSGDDVAEILALLGVRPVWAEESGRVTGVEVVPPDELGRPRVDVTVRISGFFRDAFPHVLELLDQAVSLVADLDEAPDVNPVRASGTEDPRIFGPKPGAYGSGILPLLESRNWHDDGDLAAVYVAWGGFAYGGSRGGAPAGDALRRRLAGVEVAVKNQDNREHDIFDSDDYLQDHGGMVATIRSLTGRQPKAWFGDSADPDRPRVRSLAEEAARVVRSRVLNPKWLEAMQRHGYKGAFEMAATVDYLFGYDATAGVVEDWMYERVTEAYVGDAAMRKFFEASNPWALRSIAERLLEASERQLWHATTGALDVLRAAVLEAESWEEGR